MNRVRVLVVAATALSLIASTSALAQGVKQACMADVQRMCPNAAPGRGMVMQCVKGRMTEVSPGCKTAIETARANRAARKAAAAEQPAPGSAPAATTPPPGH